MCDGIIKTVVNGVMKHIEREKIGRITRNESLIKDIGGRSIYNSMLDRSIDRYKGY